MQEVRFPNLKKEIKQYWKKDPDRLLQLIDSQLKNRDHLPQAESTLSAIIAQYHTETEKDASRKALSREIGQAKKSGEDCTTLIDQVSELSAEIKALKASRDNGCDEIQQLLKQTVDEQTTALPLTPRHFSGTQPAESNAKDPDSSFSIVDQLDETDWKTFTDSCDHANLYHDVRWHKLIERNFGQKTYALACHDQTGALRGIMPLTHMQSRLFGSFTISMPYFNYGGPLTTSPAVANELMSHAAKLSLEMGCSHMEVRETSPRDDWLCSQKKVSMVLSLPESDEALDKQLGSKLRAQVNRAATHDLEVRTGGVELVDDFYSVYSHNMRDLGTPSYAGAFFKDIAGTFSDETLITVVYKNNKAVAAGFLIGYRDKLEIPWASSLRKYNYTGANMLLYRAALSEAIRRGYKFYDFGRSTRDASTYKFKKQWGAKEYPLYWHYWTKEGQLPEINPDNPKYKLVIGVWKKLPVTVTRLIGPLIARNLP